MKYNRRKNFKSSQGHGKAKINQEKDWKIKEWTKKNLLPAYNAYHLSKKFWKSIAKKMRKCNSGYESYDYDILEQG